MKQAHPFPEWMVCISTGKLADGLEDERMALAHGAADGIQDKDEEEDDDPLVNVCASLGSA